MQKFTVTSPDGKTFDVDAPDGATQADAIKYVQDNHAQPAAPRDASPQAIAQQLAANAPAEPIGRMGRTWEGIKDPYMGVAQLGMNVIGQGDDINKSIRDNEQTYQNRRQAAGSEGLDGYRLLGNLIGTAPVMLATGGAATPEAMALANASRVARPLAMAGRGALQGAGQGLMQPSYAKDGEYAGDKTLQAGVGALTGGAFSGVAGFGARAAKPKVDPNIDFLRSKGVNPTIGQNLGAGGAATEDVFRTLNPAVSIGQRRAVREFNVAAYNDVLAPIEEKFTGEPGRDAVKLVGDKLSKAYDDLVPKLKLTPDDVFMQDLDEALAISGEMSEEAAKRLQKIIEKQLPRGPLEGEPLKRLQSTLTDRISLFEKSTSPDDQMTANALSDVRTALLDALARSNPEHAARLNGIDRGWANLVRLEKASGPTQDGVFTPAQLQSAARNADSSVRRRNFARGMGGDMQKLADAGVAVLGNKYPDSGTATRALIPGLLALGGSGAVSLPLAGTLGATALAYTPRAQQLAGSMINGNRGAGAEIASNGLQQIASPGAQALALLAAMGQKPRAQKPEQAPGYGQ